MVVKTHDGNVVCKNCGIVHEQSIIDQSNEKRQFSSEGGSDPNTSRINAKTNSLVPSMGHNTVISGKSDTAKLLNKTNYPKDGPEEKNILDG